MRIRYKKNRMVQFYESNCLTTIPHEPPPPLSRPEPCGGCPYPGHGFVCGGGESCAPCGSDCGEYLFARYRDSR